MSAARLRRRCGDGTLPDRTARPRAGPVDDGQGRACTSPNGPFLVSRLVAPPEFIEISPDCLVALDAAGRIVGHNRPAQLLLVGEHGSNVLGGSKLDRSAITGTSLVRPSIRR